MDNVFNGIYGYEEIKEELLLIKSWFENKKIIENKKVTLPKGIIFYGPYGCGKTMFMRKYIESFNCSKYIINGSSIASAEKTLKDVFTKAKKDDFALVIIDELDLLINKDPLSYRVLKEEMDGMDKSGHILILATTNFFRNIDASLLRPGRFDRKIHIDTPSKEVRITMIKKFMDELNMNYDSINFKEVADFTASCKCTDLKAIVNDVYLFAKENPTTEDFENSYSRIILADFSKSDRSNILENVAVHEVGHMLMGLHFKENFKFYNIKFLNGGGKTVIYDVDEEKDNIEKRKQRIMISLAGHEAERVIYGENLKLGSSFDYEKANDLVKKLIEKTCIYSLKDYLSPYSTDHDRFDSLDKKRRLEKRECKLLKELEKETYNYLKKNKDKIKYYTNLLMKKGCLSHKDLED